MTTTLRFAVAALLASIAVAAQAQTTVAQSGTYVAFRLAAAMPQHDDLEQYDTGMGFEAAFGRRLGPNVALEASLGRYGISDVQTATDGLGVTYKLERDLTAVPLMGTFKGILPAGNVDLYGLVGVGMYFLSFSGELREDGFVVENGEDETTAFGVHLGAGIAASLTPRLTLGGELKYIVGNAEFEDSDEEIGIDSILFGASIAYSF
jgi:opacity protein-like surface antigen